MLLLRLEKLSADSPWSHRVSGIRASLAKKISGDQPGPDQERRQEIKRLMTLGYQILERAAREISPGSIDHLSPNR